MCSICGGTSWDPIAKTIWQNAKDRGRDDSGKFHQSRGSWIGNHRATPTTEVVCPIEKQPVGDKIKIVFNGIISNDTELGIQDGEADTSVLPRVLDFKTFNSFLNSVQNILVGSYAIAVLMPTGRFWLACNYKPIWYAEDEGEFYFSSLEQHFDNTDLVPRRMKPYTAMRAGYKYFPNRTTPLYRKQEEKALVICSAGLDSTTVASVACKKHGSKNVTLMHYDYGCKATTKEMEAIPKIAEYLGCKYVIQKMPSFGGSSLLDASAEITKGIKGAEYAHEWVPARNLVMLSLTTAYAESKGYGHIYLGTNLEEAGAYPDNEEQFILDFNNLLYGAVQNGVKIEVHTPLGGLMKHEVIKLGQKLETPYHLTWSCYHGKEMHCGECGPCFMRRTAFERNGLTDPVVFKKRLPNFNK